MYNLGIALRQYYNDKNLLNYDINSTLALTSNITRCRESLDATLEGFYEITSNLERGYENVRKFRMNDTRVVPSGPGYSRIWRDVKLSTDLVKSLDYTYYMRSKYNKNHPSKLRKDLMLDEQISKLPQIGKLRQLLADRYHKAFNLSVTGLWSAIQCEMYLERTRDTLQYIDHYADWIDSPIISDQLLANADNNNSNNNNTNRSVHITLYELYEELVLLSFIGMTEVNSDYLVISPIINSLIESQQVALGFKPQNERSKEYLGKQLIFYSTHDSILSMMLHDLGIITLDGATFSERLLDAKLRGANDLEKLLAGLKMCSFGLSVKFELWKVNELPIVRLAIYNEPDPYAPKIIWQPVALGAICHRRHKELFEQAPMEVDTESSGINKDYDCPFETFSKISTPWFLNETRYDLLYNDELTMLQ